MLYLKTTEDIKVVPFLDYDKKGLFSDRVFSEDQYVPLYKSNIYVSDYRHALFLMVNDVKNNKMKGRINTYQEIAFPSGLSLPIDLSSSKVFIPLAERLENNKKDKVKIALFGGFGPAYGDNICGKTAFNILEKELSKYFKEFKLDIYHVQSDKFFEFYKRHNIEIFQEPIELSAFCEYDYYYDITAINLISGYDFQSIVDNFLWMFSVDSTKIASDRKRNQYILHQAKHVQISEHILSINSKRKKLLFHPESIQKWRHLPHDICIQLLKDILEKTDYDIYTVADIQFESDRFHNLRELSKDFDCFASIISLMDRIITVDTATYHVADAFNVPFFVIFTNAGIGRISDYPQAQGYVVDQKFLEEIENIRSNAERFNEEYDFIDINIPLVWPKFDKAKVMDYLLATE